MSAKMARSAPRPSSGLPEVTTAVQTTGCLAIRPDKRECSRQYGSHLGNPGYNAFDVWDTTHPTLTTVESRAYEMGDIAAKAMIERLETGKFSTREQVLKIKLRIGETT